LGGGFIIWLKKDLEKKEQGGEFATSDGTLAYYSVANSIRNSRKSTGKEAFFWERGRKIIRPKTRASPDQKKGTLEKGELFMSARGDRLLNKHPTPGMGSEKEQPADHIPHLIGGSTVEKSS